MKKGITAVVVVILAVVLLTTMAACRPEALAYPDLTIGAEKPTQTPTVEVNANMTPMQMMQAAMINYYQADYITSKNQGMVATTIVGGTVNQMVVAAKVRSGKAYTDATCKEYNPELQLFTDNKSHSAFAAVYEEVIIESASDVRVRAAKKGDIKSDKDEEKREYYITAKKMQDPEYISSVPKLVEDKVNDPVRLWMYDIEIDSTDAIVKAGGDTSTGVTLKDGCYEFTIDFDKDQVTKNYRDVMIYMLTQGGAAPSKLDFEGLKIKFTVWENGFLRLIDIEEKYTIQIAGIINSSITLNSRQEFGYAEVEGYKIADKLTMF